MKNNPKLLLYIAAAFIAFLLWQKWQIANLPPAPVTTSTPTLETPSVSGSDIPTPTVAGSDIPARQRHPKRERLSTSKRMFLTLILRR